MRCALAGVFSSCGPRCVCVKRLLLRYAGQFLCNQADASAALLVLCHVLGLWASFAQAPEQLLLPASRPSPPPSAGNGSLAAAIARASAASGTSGESCSFWQAWVCAAAQVGMTSAISATHKSCLASTCSSCGVSSKLAPRCVLPAAHLHTGLGRKLRQAVASASASAVSTGGQAVVLANAGTFNHGLRLIIFKPPYNRVHASFFAAASWSTVSATPSSFIGYADAKSTGGSPASAVVEAEGTAKDGKDVFVNCNA